ncbi:protein kinase C theta type-like [Pelobates fuscus]|uniref:protein kinase C theta type-like n=1 Tax=Pelobates fuscus TaxID=191477 RepID=UPI002FE4576E
MEDENKAKRPNNETSSKKKAMARRVKTPKMSMEGKQRRKKRGRWEEEKILGGICEKSLIGQLYLKPLDFAFRRELGSSSLSMTASDFEFHHELGSGSFGKVMLASWTRTKQLVAMKVMEKGAVLTTSILKERRTLEIARGCPFLCEGLAAFQTQKHVFLTMEYIRGGSLQSYMDEKSCLETYEANDLKPDNILLDGGGHVKLADFGLVAENMLKGQKTSDKTGTRYYMAPEVLADGEYDAAVDWWALGIIICEMLTGDHPYDTFLSSEEFRHIVIMRKPDYPDWVTTETKGIVSKLLMKNPKYRLGVYGNIRLHPFYGDLCWEDLEHRKIPPPYEPLVQTTQDPKSHSQERSLSFLEAWKSFSGYGHTIFGLSFTSSRLRD